VGKAYRRKEVVMTPAGDPGSFSLPGAPGSGAASMNGVAVSGIVDDPTPLRRVYDPGHPDADAAGYVTRPNVNAVTEMTDMVAATRAFQANVTAFEATKSMAKDALRIIS
jgi:flagellar basal-body rod protein FlgC